MPRLRSLLVAAATAILLLSSAAGAADRPVVVELFTSQGCSSCPPAEAFMRELAKRPGIIALEFHVDYWDYIGWKDRFAKHEFTDRQQGYVSSLKGRYKYTPQMVIDGASHVVGSDRAAFERALAEHKSRRSDGPEITVGKEGDVLVATIGAGPTEGDHDILFVTFDKEHATDVRRGENRGRKLINVRVVREYEMLGAWRGAPVVHRIPIAGRPGDGGCAVIVQKRPYGEIIAAAWLPFEQ